MRSAKSQVRSQVKFRPHLGQRHREFIDQLAVDVGSGSRPLARTSAIAARPATKWTRKTSTLAPGQVAFSTLLRQPANLLDHSYPLDITLDVELDEHPGVAGGQY